MRATEPSRSTTEYSRPWLLIITCKARNRPGISQGSTGSPATVPRARQAHLPPIRSRHTWSAGPRGPPGPPGYRTHYCRWCWTPPCLPNLPRSGEGHGFNLWGHVTETGRGGGRRTLASHDQTRYAVGNAGACRQESDAHDDIGDAESVADYSHLKDGEWNRPIRG